MPGVALEEAVSPTNPRLFFCYQTAGILTDVAELNFEVRELSTNAVRVTAADLNLADAPVGSRLGYGRYAPTFTASAANDWRVGTHVAIWRYRLVLAGTQYTVRQRFEVVDPLYFATGALYVGYADSFTLKNTSQFSSLTIEEIHNLVDSTSRHIEFMTGRFFEPRYLTSAHSGSGAVRLLLSHPIIGVSQVFEIGTGPADELYEIDRDAMRVFNRHLEGTFDPDDRDNPKIEFATDVLPGVTVVQGSFSPGSKNIEVQGVFGYTDPDGGPMGMTPRILTRVVGIFAARENQDPYAQDISTSQPGRIKSARTRDQAITFDTGSTASSAGYQGAITGDRSVDDFLIRFMRPPHLGSA